MLSNSERYPLNTIIADDLFSSNKLIMILLFAITLTAFGTVWLTDKTRELVSQNGDLVIEQQALENEYINLQLEETTLSDNARVEAIANVKLGMKKVVPEQEVVILE
ncbi:MAG: cell division protein FtsL [Pasteurellaceae bacterium]|nr:cell division protein FtsL [Pasteurellaceae bacterium]